MIWLIGAGGMAIEYFKVLKAQNNDVTVIGRSQESAKAFKAATGQLAITGGLEQFLCSSPDLPKAVIVSVGVEQLYSTSLRLLNYGVKNLLVEKPGGLIFDEINELAQKSQEEKAQVFVAYNRRFYSSAIKVQELVEKDGGVTSFNFEMTEWAHVIEKLDKKSSVLSKWFLANSTHVADMAFFLGGNPAEITCYTQGQLKWHPSSSTFSGAGISAEGALFSYSANWESAGRWSLEILTKKNRYILRPMEILMRQKRGTIKQESVEINDELDKSFKPGLYMQVDAFLSGDLRNLCSIDEQLKSFSVYEKMAGY